MFHRILVAIDLEEPTSWEKSVPAAISLARCYDATLTVATIVPDAVAVRQAPWSVTACRELLDSTRTHLTVLVEKLAQGMPIDVRVGYGGIYSGIVALASELESDLIVLASHRPAMKDYLIGANASRVVRHADCSVLVIRE